MPVPARSRLDVVVQAAALQAVPRVMRGIERGLLYRLQEHFGAIFGLDRLSNDAEWSGRLLPMRRDRAQRYSDISRPEAPHSAHPNLFLYLGRQSSVPVRILRPTSP